jgi:tetratricopeptide (TPR) repeat protein
VGALLRGRIAQLITNSFWGVFWVDVGNQSTAKNGFVAIAKALRCPTESLLGALQTLASTTRRWLLILDNADDPLFDYSVYFPSGNRGAVIMTSRIPECRKYSTVETESLEGLELVYSTRLLLKAAGVHEESWPSHTTEAQEIVRLLGSHTLALIQAGAYVAEGYCRLGQYSERYRQQRKKLLKYHSEQGQSRYQNVYATFEASVNVLKLLKDGSGTDALELLAILSVLHSSVLPMKVFQDAWAGARLWLQIMGNFNTCPKQHPRWRLPKRIGHSWRGTKQATAPKSWNMAEICAFGQEHWALLPGFLGIDSDKWDNYRLKKASALLTSLSLVKHHQSDDFDGLSMHPLAHAWAKDRLDTKEQQQAWVSTACIFGISRRMTDVWLVYERQLHPHVQTLFSSSPETLWLFAPQTLMLPIAMSCGWLLLAMREYKLLHTLLQCIYQDLKISPWHPSAQHLPIWTLASRIQAPLHDVKLAIVLLESVTNAEKTLLVETNPERLVSQYNLASAYNGNGEPKKAVPLLEHLVKMYETTPPGGMYSAMLPLSQYELAHSYTALGRPEESVIMLEHVVKLQETAEEGPSRNMLTRSQDALAAAYIMNNQTKEALALLEHVTTVQDLIFKEAHPARLLTQIELTRACLYNGEFEKALSLIERVVDIKKNCMLEESDRSLLASQFMLAIVYDRNKRVKEARELLHHVVRVYETTADETHPDRLAAELALALAHVDDGEKGKALKLAEHIVKMRQVTLDSTHPHRLHSEQLLANLQAEAV